MFEKLERGKGYGPWETKLNILIYLAREHPFKHVPTADVHFHVRDAFHIRSTKEVREHLQALADLGYLERQDVFTVKGFLDTYTWKLKDDEPGFIRLSNLAFKHGRLTDFMRTRTFSVLLHNYLPKILSKSLQISEELIPNYYQYSFIYHLIEQSRTAFHSVINRRRAAEDLDIIEHLIKIDLKDKRSVEKMRTLYYRRPIESVEKARVHARLLDRFIAYLTFCFLADLLQRENRDIFSEEVDLILMLNKYNFKLSLEGKHKYIFQ